MTDKLTTEDVLRKLNADLEAQVLEMEGDLDSALTKLNIAKGQASERARRIRELSKDKEYWRKRCVDLEEQIEADDVDFMRVTHAREVEKLRELCRDMYGRICYYNETNDRLQFDDRMEQLGLIHETEYDPDTGLKLGEQQCE